MTSSFGAMIRRAIADFIQYDLREQGNFALDPDLFVSDVVDVHENTDDGYVYTNLVYEVRDFYNEYRYQSFYVYHGSFMDLLKELIFQ